MNKHEREIYHEFTKGKGKLFNFISRIGMNYTKRREGGKFKMTLKMPG